MAYTNGQQITVRLTVVDTHDRGRLVLSPGPTADDSLTISEATLEAIEVRAPVARALGKAKAKLAKRGRAGRARRAARVEAGGGGH